MRSPMQSEVASISSAQSGSITTSVADVQRDQQALTAEVHRLNKALLDLMEAKTGSNVGCIVLLVFNIDALRCNLSSRHLRIM